MNKILENEVKEELSRIMKEHSEFDLKVAACLFVHHFIIRNLQEKQFQSELEAVAEGMKLKSEVEKSMIACAQKLENDGILKYDNVTMKVKLL